MKLTLILLISLGVVAVTKATGYHGRCSLTVPSNGKITKPYTYKKYANNNEWVTYQCNYGYTLSGSSKRQCKNGKLSGTACTCQKPSSGCKVTGKPAYGISLPRVGATVKYSGRVIYKCYPSYTLVGDGNQVCHKNGKFSGSVPKCTQAASPKCKVIGYPKYGSVTPRVGQYLSPGERVRYGCNHEYRLSGDGNQLCLRSGKFSGGVPECIQVSPQTPQKCKVLGRPQNGYSKPAVNDYVISGGRVMYYCHKNHRLVGDGNQLCTNGKFSGEIPKCVPAAPPKCKVIGYPKYGSVTPGVGHYVSPGQRVIYKCNHGYRLSGDGNQLCLRNGKFSGGVPECIQEKCKVLGKPQNGYSKPDVNDYVISGGRVMYYCHKNHRLVGDGNQLCTNGKFSGEIPKCVPITCTVIRAPVGGSVEPSSGSVNVGGTVEYSCDLGFQIEGAPMLTCKSNGKFDYPRPSCKAVQCTVGRAPANGFSDPEDGTRLSVGDSVEYRCGRGFELVGSDELTCMPDEGFSDDVPRCQERITCPIPMTSSPLDSFPFSGVLQEGENVSYYCSGEEYELVGSGIAYCTQEGLSNSPPECVLRTCRVGRDDVPRYGAVNPQVGKEVSVGDSITYSCNVGYMTDGAEVAVCKANGDFTWSPPNCVPVQCTVPMAPRNGDVQPDDVQKVGLNDYVSFKCDPGYDLVGTENIKCIGNERFDDNTPTCRGAVPKPKRQCTKPNYVQRLGKLVLTPNQYSYYHGSKLVVSCDDRADTIAGGKDTTYCNDGNWVPELRPVCSSTVTYH